MIVNRLRFPLIVGIMLFGCIVSVSQSNAVAISRGFNEASNEVDMLASEDLRAFIRFEGHLLYNSSLFGLNFTKVTLQQEEPHYYDLVLESELANVNLNLLMTAQDPDRTVIDHVQVNLKSPLDGISSCKVNSIHVFRGQHVKCDIPREFECYVYRSNQPSGVTAPYVQQFAQLVITSMEYEIVRDASLHENLKFHKEAELCNRL